jgi:hypothetical protein
LSLIDPSEPANRPTTGHGYNPFRNSDLWFDKDGFLHTRVLDSDFKYADGKWSPSAMTQEKDSIIPPLPIEQDGPVLGPDTSKVMPWKTSKTIFRGFHFYRTEGNGEKQLDLGLNPLATYPFSSGLVPAILDPQDRIWAGGRDINAHPNDATWYVERNRQNSNSPL